VHAPSHPIIVASALSLGSPWLPFLALPITGRTEQIAQRYSRAALIVAGCSDSAGMVPEGDGKEAWLLPTTCHLRRLEVVHIDVSRAAWSC